jgi:hypothetical protein
MLSMRVMLRGEAMREQGEQGEGCPPVGLFLEEVGEQLLAPHSLCEHVFEAFDQLRCLDRALC